MYRFKKVLALALAVMLVFAPVSPAAKVTSAKTSFAKGEFSPLLLGRLDIAAYANGAKKVENFLINNAGGATRRPGSYYAATVKDSDDTTRIIDFQFSTDQAYILEIGDYYTRFYTDQGQVQNTTHAITGASKANPCVITSADHPFQDGDEVTITDVAGMTQLNTNTYTVANRTASTYDLSGINSSAYGVYTSGGIATRTGALEIPTPYTKAQVFDLQYAQSEDVAYVVHESHEVMKLERLSATSWKLTEVDFVRGPFLDDNITAVTITPSADAGAGITLTASAATFLSTHIGSLWKIKGGVVKITAYTSALIVTGTVQEEPDGSAGALGTGPGATTDWAEGAFSDAEGHPTSVTFHEGRLVFAKDQKIFASYAQSFENFAIGATAADAFIYKIATEQVNAIRWVSSGPKALQVGTSGGTFSFSSGNEGIPITPTAIVVTRDTTYGSAKVMPKRIGNFVYFVQRNLKVLRELGFDFDTDSQQALDMTLLSDHITGDGIVDMAYQQAPNDTLWCVRSDGQIATLTRQIDQEVIGWSRQISGNDSVGPGDYESVAVVPIDEGDDEVWVIVKRYINGSFVRYVEYFKPREFDEQHDAFFVDSGISLDTAKAITNIVPKTAIDDMEYASDILAQAAWVTDASIDAYTELLLHFNGVNGAVTTVDSSGNNVPITFVGTAQLSTAVKKFGSASLLLDGNSDYVTAPDSASWHFGTGALTLEFWIQSPDDLNTGDVIMMQQLVDTNNGWSIETFNSGKFRFYQKEAGVATVDLQTAAVYAWAANTKYHIALIRGWSGNANDWALCINGTAVKTVTDADDMADFATTLKIGGNLHSNSSAEYVNGYIDEVRISKGIARWTSNFTPPTSAYTGILQAYSESSIKQQGSYSLKVVTQITESLNKTLTNTLGTAIDLTGLDSIKFDVRASRTGSNFKIGFHDSGGTTTEHTANIAAADTWQTETIDISAVSNANKDDIDSVIITITNADDINTIYIDNIYSPITTVTVTSASHGFSDGDTIIIIDVVGMTELNGNKYLVGTTTDDTFALNDLTDVALVAASYGTYISGGEARECVSALTGLDHLIGETVNVVGDGVVLPDQVVSAAGGITLPTLALVVHVGLPYTPIIQGLPLIDGSATGTGAGKVRRIYKAIIRFYRTLEAEFGNEDKQDSVSFSGNDLFTGIKEVDVPENWDRLGEFYIKQTQPLPITILYLILLSQVNDE